MFCIFAQSQNQKKKSSNKKGLATYRVYINASSQAQNILKILIYCKTFTKVVKERIPFGIEYENVLITKSSSSLTNLQMLQVKF